MDRGEGVGASLVLRRGLVGSALPEGPAVARGPALPGLVTSPLPMRLFFISRASSFFNLQPPSAPVFPVTQQLCVDDIMCDVAGK